MAEMIARRSFITGLISLFAMPKRAILFRFNTEGKYPISGEVIGIRYQTISVDELSEFALANAGGSWALIDLVAFGSNVIDLGPLGLNVVENRRGCGLWRAPVQEFYR